SKDDRRIQRRPASKKSILKNLPLDEAEMQVVHSRKGTYLTVMAAVAFLFVIFLYVAPSFWSVDHPLPPAEFFIVVAVLAVLAVAVTVWRITLRNRRHLNCREGVVSGQTLKQ